MLNLRALASIAFFLGLAAEKLTAEITPGSAAITTASSPITVNGKPVGTVAAGQSVTVLGVQASARQAAVSYQPASGPKVVGLVPLDNLIAIDGPAVNTPAPASATTTVVPTVAQATTAVAAAIPALDLATPQESIQVAKFFKADKVAAKEKCEGQRFKVKGIIDRLDLDTGSGGGDMPILFLRSGTGLPRMKVKLSNSLNSNDVFFRRYQSSIPDWWWGYRDRSLDFRMVGLNEIQVRAVYRYTNTTRWSDGTTSSSRTRSNSSWFTIFKVGEAVAIEATCKGLYMDVEFENGIMTN